jgi:hypothetical protein
MYQTAWALIERAQKVADAQINEHSDDILLCVVLAAVVIAVRALLRRGHPEPAPPVRVVWNHPITSAPRLTEGEDIILCGAHADAEPEEWRE